MADVTQGTGEIGEEFAKEATFAPREFQGQAKRLWVRNGQCVASVPPPCRPAAGPGSLVSVTASSSLRAEAAPRHAGGPLMGLARRGTLPATAVLWHKACSRPLSLSQGRIRRSHPGGLARGVHVPSNSVFGDVTVARWWWPSRVYLHQGNGQALQLGLLPVHQGGLQGTCQEATVSAVSFILS